VASKKYSKEEKKNIHSATWTYIKFETVNELETNRASLYSLINDLKITYIVENWLPKKARIIRCVITYLVV
jgi:hypothetical protein